MLELSFTNFPVLETERLKLRQLTMDDAPVLLELRSNALTTRYTDRAKMTSMEEAMEKMKVILSMVEKNEGIAWAIELKETKKQACGQGTLPR